MKQLILVEFQTSHFTFRMLLPDNYTEKQASETMAAQMVKHSEQYECNLKELEDDIINGGATASVMEIGLLYRDFTKL